MMILFTALVLLPVAAGTWGSTTAAASTTPWYQTFSGSAATPQDNKASNVFGDTTSTASATLPDGRGQFFGATVTAAGAPTTEVQLGGSSSSNWGDSAVNAFSIANAETESRIFGSDNDSSSGSGKGGKGGKGSSGSGSGEGGGSRIFGSDGDSGDGESGKGGSGKGGSGKGGSSSGEGGGSGSRIFGNDGGDDSSGGSGKGKGGKGGERRRGRRTYEVLTSTSGDQRSMQSSVKLVILFAVGVVSVMIMKV